MTGIGILNMLPTSTNSSGISNDQVELKQALVPVTECLAQLPSTGNSMGLQTQGETQLGHSLGDNIHSDITQSIGGEMDKGWDDMTK